MSLEQAKLLSPENLGIELLLGFVLGHHEGLVLVNFLRRAGRAFRPFGHLLL